MPKARRKELISLDGPDARKPWHNAKITIDESNNVPKLCQIDWCCSDFTIFCNNGPTVGMLVLTCRPLIYQSSCN